MDTTVQRNTIGRMVAPGPLAWAPPAPPRKQRALLAIVPLAIVAALIGRVAYFDVPYVTLAPGQADEISTSLSVPEDRNNPPRGQILITTVALRRATIFDVVRGWLDPDIDVLEEAALFGDVDPAQYTREAQQDMQDSKEDAVVVALRRLGYPVTEHGEGALVMNVGVDPDVPAAGTLRPGDTVTAVDDQPTMLASELIRVLQTKRPGQTVRLDVTSAAGGPSVERSVTLGGRTAQGCSRAVAEGPACLGIEPGTRGRRYDLPFEVKIDTRGIGGPSAGLAFTLALLDQLTPGELTGGKKVAVTGTIDENGFVGQVGGVRQKIAAVKAAGADAFLVPAAEFEIAKSLSGENLKVFSVTTLEEALAALGQIGGDLAALPANTAQGSN